MVTESHPSLSDFVATPEEADTANDDSKFPVQVNGHRVIRVEPDTHVRGSGDQDLAFQCEHCGEEQRIPEDRAVPDHEYAHNSFSLTPCRSAGGATA